MTDVHCPFCGLTLKQVHADETACDAGHVFDTASLTLAANMAAARALWQAVRAMEDDAAGLLWRAERPGSSEESVSALTAQAGEATRAAGTLRDLAVAAQRRLDALPLPLRVVRLTGDATI